MAQIKDRADVKGRVVPSADYRRRLVVNLDPDEPDRLRAAVALVAAGLVLAFSTNAWAQVAVLTAAGLFGWAFLRTDSYR